MWKDETNLDVASRSSLAGKAFVSGVCGTWRYSVSEDHGGFSSLVVRLFIYKIFKNINGL